MKPIGFPDCKPIGFQTQAESVSSLYEHIDG